MNNLDLESNSTVSNVTETKKDRYGRPYVAFDRYVQRIHITGKDAKPFFDVCHLSKNVFNSTLYQYRQEYFKGNSIYESDIIKQFRKNNQVDFRKLPSIVAQITMQNVSDAFKGFYALCEKYKEGKIKNRPNIPNYLDTKTKSYYVTTIPKDNGFSVKDNCIVFAKQLNLKKFKLHSNINQDELTQIRLKPETDRVILELVFKKPKEDITSIGGSKIMSIDFGVDNLATTITVDLENNTGYTPIIYSGKQIVNKVVFNQKQIGKKRSKLQKFKKTIKNKKTGLMEEITYQKSSKAIKKQYNKQTRQVESMLHQTSSAIITDCINNQIGYIVIGYNTGWKQSSDMSPKSNQKFVYMPHGKLKDQLIYKAKKHGIEIILQEESYTSKCDGLAEESIQYHSNYKGDRKHRGLFVSSIGKTINADVNGAVNIFRKYLKCNSDKHSISYDWLSALQINGFMVNPIIRNPNLTVLNKD